MNWLDIGLRPVVALVCGALIGSERQYRQHSAGLRTSALVATGSALFVLAAALTTNDSSPLRVAAQVVSGVGFLCAGVIIRDGLNVRGLNTAGTLWCASGVGVLAGSGFYLVAAAGAVVVLLANLLLRPLARTLDQPSKSTGQTSELPVHYVVRAVCLSQQENHIRSLLLQGVSGSGLTLQALQSADTPDPTRVEVRADLQADGRKDTLLEQVVARLSLEESISAVRWEVSSDSDENGTPFPALPPGPNSSEAEASILGHLMVDIYRP
jgi:putative Mg2+ transporter-C (MgtC) family protein